MNPSVIQFACGHCQSWLTVPAHLAGVAGPCPKCGQHIVSPRETQAAQPTPMPQWAPAPERPASQPLTPSGATMADVSALLTPRAQVPMQPQAWGQIPGQAAVPEQAQAMPSVAMQPSLLRPGSFNGQVDQGPALAPPQAPPSPVAEALRGLPTQPGGVPAATPSMPMSRPATVTGSRLSLLARQLPANESGTQGLPPAPKSMSSTDLPGADKVRAGVPMTPNSVRYEQANHLAFEQHVQRGLNANVTQRSGGWGKLVALVLVLGILGGGAWAYKQGLVQNLLATYLPAAKEEPEIAHAAPTLPVPGVDPAPQAVPPALPPKPKETVVKAPPEPETISPPPPATAANEPEVIKPVVATAPTETPTADPEPPRAQPVDPASVTVSMPPRAAIVDEVPAQASTPATDPSTGVTPAVADTTTIKPAEVAKAVPNPLVEIGRSREALKVLPETGSAPLTDSSDRPSAKNVPPTCMKALDGLKRFLAARNWKERVQYTQLPDEMVRKMQMYYAGNSDGPVDVDEIHYLRHDESPEVGKGMQVVFILFSRLWDFGFPIMVEQVGDEARVDWLTFVEFKDDMLHKFLSSYMEGPIRFHLGIRRTHYFEDNVPGVDQKDSFEITTPMENVHGFVFVPKGTALQRSLASTISWDKELSWVIAELEWRREGPRKWVELTALPQLNWYAAENTVSADAPSAPTSPVAKP